MSIVGNFCNGNPSQHSLSNEQDDGSLATDFESDAEQ